MPRNPLRVTRVVSVWILAVVPTVGVSAQEQRTGLTAGVALSTQYPDRFQEGCGNPAAVVPSVRFHHRIHRIVAAELGISGAFQVPPGPYCSSGDEVPLNDGDLVRRFDTSRGNISVSSEARVVLTPIRSEDGALRLIGGGAWFAARRAPAWILGAGYRPPRSWGALVFDVEYWSVGVRYDLERFRVGAPSEFLRSGREWQGLLQIRAGITIWSN